MYRNKKINDSRSRVGALFLILLLLGLGLLFARISVAAEYHPQTEQRNESSPWRLHFWAAPSTDGTSLFVSTAQTSVQAGTVRAQAVGPTGKIGVGMSYNGGNSAYEVLIGAIFPAGSSIVEGQLSLTTDLDNGETLDTGPVDLRRFFVPTTNASPVVSNDNLLEMTISNNSLAADAYVVVMPTNDLPGSLPQGHQLVGSPYSVRPSGANFTSNNPLLLKLFYTTVTLGNFEPHTLSILQWDPVASAWVDLGGTLDDFIENSFTATSERFTVYGLMSAPRWADDFNDFTGLSAHEKITVLLPSGSLVLNGEQTGTAISRPITPTVPIEEWGTLSFAKTVPDGTSLTIDVLDINDNLLLSDVTSDTSLASLDPALYASLKLRANFSTNDQATTPRLGEWRLDWQPMEPETVELYLPAILKP